MLGGTGPFGRGLAGRLALGGVEVRIGSRSRSRAEAAAAEVRRRLESALPVAGGRGAAGEHGAAVVAGVPGGRGTTEKHGAAGEHGAAGRRGAAGPGEGRSVGRVVGRTVGRIVGRTNREAVAGADPVFLAAPFAAQDALLRDPGVALAGRLVICCAVLWPPGSRPETSAAEEAERSLAAAGVPGVRLAAAFQTVAAGTLAAIPDAEAPDPETADPETPSGSTPPEVPDVLVFADRDEDREAAARAAAHTGLRAVPAGPLRGVRAAEAAVGLLLDLGRRGTALHPGVRITGVAAPAGEPR